MSVRVGLASWGREERRRRRRALLHLLLQVRLAHGSEALGPVPRLKESLRIARVLNCILRCLIRIVGNHVRVIRAHVKLRRWIRHHTKC